MKQTEKCQVPSCGGGGTCLCPGHVDGSVSADLSNKKENRIVCDILPKIFRQQKPTGNSAFNEKNIKANQIAISGNKVQTETEMGHQGQFSI